MEQLDELEARLLEVEKNTFNVKAIGKGAASANERMEIIKMQE